MKADPFIIKRLSSTESDTVTSVEILLKTGEVGLLSMAVLWLAVNIGSS